MAGFWTSARWRIRRAKRALPVYGVRVLPLPPRVKERLVWELSPHFRLGVFAVIRNDRDEVLILRPTYMGGWQLPGGSVGHGEPFELAMRREVSEEIGLDVASLEEIGLVQEPNGRDLRLLYRCNLPEGIIRLSAEHATWCYRPVRDLPSPLREYVESVPPAAPVRY